jgi:hypothetical protein
MVAVLGTEHALSIRHLPWGRIHILKAPSSESPAILIGKHEYLTINLYTIDVMKTRVIILACIPLS